MPLRKESETAKTKREAEIAAVLERNGAKVKARNWRVEWVLKTTVGDLLIVPMEEWVHCRFLDVPEAVKVLDKGSQCRLNPASGKWNWHDWDGRTQAANIEAIFAELRRYKLISEAEDDPNKATDAA